MLGILALKEPATSSRAAGVCGSNADVAAHAVHHAAGDFGKRAGKQGKERIGIGSGQVAARRAARRQGSGNDARRQFRRRDAAVGDGAGVESVGHAVKDLAGREGRGAADLNFEVRGRGKGGGKRIGSDKPGGEVQNGGECSVMHGDTSRLAPQRRPAGGGGEQAEGHELRHGIWHRRTVGFSEASLKVHGGRDNLRNGADRNKHQQTDKDTNRAFHKKKTFL